MAATELRDDDPLPLTCTRAGTCCHGKAVWISPWELACLAAARGIGTRDFRRQHTTCGGIRLRFDGPVGFRGRHACNLYRAGEGCTAHPGRPLACRLYPLGRERRGESVRFTHEGTRLPCFDDGCPEVASLPQLLVRDYIVAQGAGPGIAAQDATLDLAADLAEGAFVLLFDTGLYRLDRTVPQRWRDHAEADAAQRAVRLPEDWLADLTAPAIAGDPADPLPWIDTHRTRLRTRMETLTAPRSAAEAADASALLMGLALHLAQGGGADARRLGAGWADDAQARIDG